MDGKSFEGKLRFTGLFRLLGGRITIEFGEGILAWTESEGFEPAPYETREDHGNLIFTARAVGDFLFPEVVTFVFEQK